MDDQNDALSFRVYGDPVDILKIDTSASAVVHVSMDANMKMMSALGVDNNITCQNLTLNKHVLSNGDGIQMIVYRDSGGSF